LLLHGTKAAMRALRQPVGMMFHRLALVKSMAVDVRGNNIL